MSSSGKCKIPIQEILSATNGFAEENIIGAGGYGKVYRGQSKQYGLLAIKRLIIGPIDQGDHEYGMEIELLSKYKHENLVSLVGFCGEGEERILAYKYEANGSLDKVLHRKDLSWTCRLQICRDAARGLRYLHNESGSEHGVIHRDIKSSNILLDENWKAKISDFGLSKIALTKSPNSVMFTRICGTFGYLDPEYQQDGTLTQKSDVYSFGVVLFEVLLGKLVSPFPKFVHDCYFNLEMAKKHYQNRTLNTMIDPDIRNQMNSDSFSTFSSIAYECLKNLRKDRPAINSVVEALEKALAYQQASSGSSSSRFLHDVYISFRLEFSNTYAFDKLCDVLEREGLSTYKGNIRGSRKESDLLSAIKRSRSFIIIFSKNFAANSWNLDEVAEIVKCMKERGSVVVPVFSDDVYPSEVREQKGYFGEAMSKYDTHPRIVEWKNALIEVTNVPGLEESDFRYYTDLGKEAAARIKGPSPQLTSTQPSIYTYYI